MHRYLLRDQEFQVKIKAGPWFDWKPDAVTSLPASFGLLILDNASLVRELELQPDAPGYAPAKADVIKVAKKLVKMLRAAAVKVSHWSLYCPV